MEPFILLSVCVTVPILLVLGVLMFLTIRALRRAQKRSQELRETPLVEIGQLTSGLQKIEGQIRGHEKELRSPFSKRKCVFYRFHVQEMQTRGGKHPSSHWVTIIDDKRGIDVTIADDTGEIEINLDEADVNLKTKKLTQSGTFNDASPELEELMSERYGKSTKGLLFNRGLRYTESYLRDGDNVLVIGDVKVHRSRAPEFYKGEHHLMITDMAEADVASAQSSKTLFYWIAIAFLGFFMLGTCGFGAMFAIIGVSAAKIRDNMLAPGLPKPNRPMRPMPNLPLPNPPIQPERPATNPRPIDREWNENNMMATFLRAMQEENVQVGFGKFGKGILAFPVVGKGFNPPITVDGQAFPKAISMHPFDNGEASVQYHLGGEYKLFKARAALNDMTAKGAAAPLTFKVFGDGDLLWFSAPPLQAKNDRQEIRLSVKDVNNLEMRVHCAGIKIHAYSVWLDPQVLK